MSNFGYRILCRSFWTFFRHYFSPYFSLNFGAFVPAWYAFCWASKGLGPEVGNLCPEKFREKLFLSIIWSKSLCNGELCPHLTMEVGLRRDKKMKIVGRYGNFLYLCRNNCACARICAYV